jgi:hypothetical protein
MADPETDRALDRLVLRRVIVMAAVFLTAVTAVNALTLITDGERAGTLADSRVPWVLEITSVIALFVLIPLVGLWERRFPFAPDNWRMLLLAHLGGSIVFSALHIVGLWLLRSLIWPVMFGAPYIHFADLPTDLIYEYRKDVLPYAVLILLLTLFRSIEEHRREAEIARDDARSTGRLTLKSGGRTLFLDAQSLDWAEAAGNYVEIRAVGATHLARVSLSALEQQLLAAGVDVVRVHRSRLVNRAKILEIAPTSDGDFHVRMSDGTQLRGSRRFRTAVV